jgi:hypothetical protein
MKLVLTLISMVVLVPFASHAQSSFHVLDEACVSAKVAQCMGRIILGSVPTLNDMAIVCPKGWALVPESKKPFILGNGASISYTQDCALDMEAGFITAEKGPVDLGRLESCTKMVRGFPKAGGPSCLVEVDANRLITSLEKDIRLLIKEVCEARGGKNCDSIK